MSEFVLYGSGGHAKVVMESIASEGGRVSGIFDDAPKVKEIKSAPVLGTYHKHMLAQAALIICIGNNKIRQSVAGKTRHHLGKTICKSSIVSADAAVGEGSVVLHGAIVQTDARIGVHVIINTGAIVEHDCVIGDFVHIAPGAVVCGHVEIGEGTLIGANAVVAPLVKIGKWCQISAGTSVLEDVPDYSLVMGVPGEIIKTLV